MPALARVDLEHLLEARKLAATIVGPATNTVPEPAKVAPTGISWLDGHLRGGWPRGEVSEVVGPLSTGASWIACRSLAEATRRGELAALIDPLDTFDPETAAAAEFAWSHFLWVRGAARAADVVPGSSRDHEHVAWAIERALKAVALILQAEGFGLVVLDLQDCPPPLVARLPFTTWRRVQRWVEGREATCLVVHRAPVGRSAGGITLALEPIPRGGAQGSWRGVGPRARRLAGLTAHGRIVRAQWQGALDGFALNSTE